MANDRRDYMRLYKQRQRAEARLQGVCIVCVRNPVADRAVCEDCSDRAVEWQRSHNWQKRRDQ